MSSYIDCHNADGLRCKAGKMAIANLRPSSLKVAKPSKDSESESVARVFCRFFYFAVKEQPMKPSWPLVGSPEHRQLVGLQPSAALSAQQ